MSYQTTLTNVFSFITGIITNTDDGIVPKPKHLPSNEEEELHREAMMKLLKKTPKEVRDSFMVQIRTTMKCDNLGCEVSLGKTEMGTYPMYLTETFSTVTVQHQIGQNLNAKSVKCGLKGCNGKKTIVQEMTTSDWLIVCNVNNPERGKDAENEGNTRIKINGQNYGLRGVVFKKGGNVVTTTGGDLPSMSRWYYAIYQLIPN